MAHALNMYGGGWEWDEIDTILAVVLLILFRLMFV